MMKKIELIIILSTMLSFINGISQSSEVKAIEKTIIAFSKAGDHNNVEELNTYLDDNYRIVMNRLFGSATVDIVPKSVYLEKIRTKEWGGDMRTLTIEKTTVNGSTASSKVIFKGTKITFVSLITLLKNEKKIWKLVSDVPIVQ